MTAKLNDIELRVLGVLMEKALTTPDAYPLTINAIVAGCNQKQNRDPILSLSGGDVSRSLQTLGHRGLAHQAPPEPGARANRFRHTVVEALHWDKRQQAIMSELMLRGRQTPGELRGRAQRMCGFADVPAVLTTLTELAQSDTPFVEELPREPGRSANRWRHLLAESEEQTVAETPCASAPDRAMSAPPGDRPPASTAPDLIARLDALERRVAALEQRLADT